MPVACKFRSPVLTTSLNSMLISAWLLNSHFKSSTVFSKVPVLILVDGNSIQIANPLNFGIACYNFLLPHMSALLGSPAAFSFKIHLGSTITYDLHHPPSHQYLLDGSLQEALNWLFHSAPSLTDNTEQPKKSLSTMADHTPARPLQCFPFILRAQNLPLPTRL